MGGRVLPQHHTQNCDGASGSSSSDRLVLVGCGGREEPVRAMGGFDELERKAQRMHRQHDELESKLQQADQEVDEVAVSIGKISEKAIRITGQLAQIFETLGGWAAAAKRGHHGSDSNSSP